MRRQNLYLGQANNISPGVLAIQTIIVAFLGLLPVDDIPNSFEVLDRER